MTENIRKLMLYFQPYDTYWQNTDPTKQKYFKESALGFFPQSIIPRIEQGHYQYFDEDGIPCFPNHKGIMIHHFTTMASYALGQWEYWLMNGKEEHKEIVLKIANYMARVAIPYEDDTLLLLDYEDAEEKSGNPCAMNQGEAMSVFARAYEITKDQSYLDTALKCANAFKKRFEDRGICGTEPKSGLTWYLEGGRFILNGHNYALFGLYDLYKITGSEEIKSLFDQGYNNMVSLLSAFDNGYWSWYWLDEKKYIASMMYHNLHICQLKGLHQMRPDKKLKKQIVIFESYAKDPVKRLKAGKELWLSKLKNRLN